MTEQGRHPIPSIAVVGCGTIGKRVADAIAAQPDMRLAGIGVRAPSPNALIAARRGFPLYATGSDGAAPFDSAGIKVAGDLDDLLAISDAVLDCTPRRQAEQRYTRYASRNTPVVLQGGESHDITGFTFFPTLNYRSARGRLAARVPSCNTTGLVRLLCALRRVVEPTTVRVVLARCASDPDKARKGVVNGAVTAFGRSHHGQDVQLLMPELDIETQAVTVPMTRGHTISLFADLAEPISRQQLCWALQCTARVSLIEDSALAGTHQLTGLGSGKRTMRGDRPNLLIWEPSIEIDGRRLCLQALVHMESIVVPETVDCVRALLGLQDTVSAAIQRTDAALGLSDLGDRAQERAT